MSRISGLRNDMNKRTIYKERKINNRSFDFLSKQNIIVPLILDINDITEILPDNAINTSYTKRCRFKNTTSATTFIDTH